MISFHFLLVIAMVVTLIIVYKCFTSSNYWVILIVILMWIAASLTIDRRDPSKEKRVLHNQQEKFINKKIDNLSKEKGPIVIEQKTFDELINHEKNKFIEDSEETFNRYMQEKDNG